MDSVTETKRFDLRSDTLRDVNKFLHGDLSGINTVRVENPDGAHSIAVGLNAPVHIDILGHAGYYAAGMNQLANVVVHGNAAAERRTDGVYLSGKQSGRRAYSGSCGDTVGAGEITGRMDIGRLSPAFPVTPPDMRVRIRRFGGLSYRRTVNLGSPSESK